jgi:hypothetical protein
MITRDARLLFELSDWCRRFDIRMHPAKGGFRAVVVTSPLLTRYEEYCWGSFNSNRIAGYVRNMNIYRTTGAPLNGNRYPPEVWHNEIMVHGPLSRILQKYDCSFMAMVTSGNVSGVLKPIIGISIPQEDDQTPAVVYQFDEVTSETLSDKANELTGANARGLAIANCESDPGASERARAFRSINELEALLTTSLFEDLIRRFRPVEAGV